MLKKTSQELFHKMRVSLLKKGDIKNYIKLMYTITGKNHYYSYTLFDDYIALYLNRHNEESLKFSFEELNMSQKEIKRSFHYNYWIDDGQMIHPLSIKVDTLIIYLNESNGQHPITLLINSDHNQKPLDKIYNELNAPSQYSLGLNLSEFNIKNEKLNIYQMSLYQNHKVDYVNATDFIRDINDGQDDRYVFKVREYNKTSEIEKDLMYGLKYNKK